MSNSIRESDVAEIYVEDRASQEAFDTEEIADVDSEEAKQGKGVVSAVTESRTIVGKQIKKAKKFASDAMKHNMKINQKRRLYSMTQAQTMILFPVMIVLPRRMMRTSILRLQLFLPLRYLTISHDHEHNN
jgi:predicted nucleic acid-binding Zn ribbon protein